MNNEKILKLIDQEYNRQEKSISLIASENYTPKIVRDVVGSVLMNKYVEGLPGHRYYAGCEFIDQIESQAIELFKELFKAEHANVQPHCGTNANFAVYFALLKPADTILSMNLAAGGHLTHGSKISMSGALYNIVSYGVDQKTELIDYEVVAKLAEEHKPKLIIAGASSYSRIIDFKKFAEISKLVGAYFMADVAHTAGMIAAGVHPSPVPFADVVTFTTHKTFRGPRGGVILCRSEIASKIDRAVMPGTQGGAFAHEIAAKAVAAQLAQKLEFIEYQKQVVASAAIMADEFKKLGYKIISGGTDTHLFLVDVRPLGFNGKEIEIALEKINIFVNRNAIPFDTLPPLQGGGIRIGTPAIVSRQSSIEDCIQVVHIIHELLGNLVAQKSYDYLKDKVLEITKKWNAI